MTLECKCHGVSGSCSVRTCWLAMADFRRTGDHLRRKYNGAVQVAVNQYGTGFTAAHTHFKLPGKYDLVYLEDSPDYCVRDQESGGRPTGNLHLHLQSSLIAAFVIDEPFFLCEIYDIWSPLPISQTDELRRKRVYSGETV